MDSIFYLILVGAALGIYLGYYKFAGNSSIKKNEPKKPFPAQWRFILSERVAFYQRLSPTKKLEFEKRVHIFLLNVQIKGINTEVTHVDRILVASGAIIPIFGFDSWHYANLKEVQIHPDKFIIPTTQKLATGLVGWGAMEGKMMLSRKALHDGFYDQTDNMNVGIHEFIHILDKQDGKIDGVLGQIMQEIDIAPWLGIIHQKMQEIEGGDSTLRSYGQANSSEFLAVASEFFFENPERMKSEHSSLYNALDSFYNPKVSQKINLFQRLKQPGGYNKSER